MISFKKYLSNYFDLYEKEDYYEIPNYIIDLSKNYYNIKEKFPYEKEKLSKILNEVRMLFLYFIDLEDKDEISNWIMESPKNIKSIYYDDTLKRVVYSSKKCNNKDVLNLYQFLEENFYNIEKKFELRLFIHDVFNDEFVKLLYDNFAKDSKKNKNFTTNLLTIIVLVNNHCNNIDYILNLMKQDNVYDKYNIGYFIEENNTIYTKGIEMLNIVFKNFMLANYDQVEEIEEPYYIPNEIENENIKGPYYMISRLAKHEESFHCLITKEFFENEYFGLMAFFGSYSLDMFYEYPYSHVFNITRNESNIFKDLHSITINALNANANKEVIYNLLHNKEDVFQYIYKISPKEYQSYINSIRTYINENKNKPQIKDYINYEMKKTIEVNKKY